VNVARDAPGFVRDAPEYRTCLDTRFFHSGEAAIGGAGTRTN
jgi:hypothetical protein